MPAFGNLPIVVAVPHEDLAVAGPEGPLDHQVCEQNVVRDRE
jgi:hypothetical protein